jgi:hypothetical protein
LEVRKLLCRLSRICRFLLLLSQLSLPLFCLLNPVTCGG